MILVRGVASTVPIERLSQRVNIFLNTKHMHILWGPMCVSPTMIGEHDHAYNLKINKDKNKKKKVKERKSRMVGRQDGVGTQ
ncbi:hypothetical protein HZH66_011820 [Vespula vulgaris]|uniref:Uncharacterized protein n=1 Tax=Vespula vulgaris TaxID=7454 RepID=A0A834JC96_VESVU|nr:hypothetical protein HZH66_011820 [Vespula vulgaris]